LFEIASLRFDGIDAYTAMDQACHEIGDLSSFGERDYAWFDDMPVEQSGGTFPIIDIQPHALSVFRKLRPTTIEHLTALIEDDHVIAELFHLGEQVRTKDDRQTSFAMQALDEFPHLMNPFRIGPLVGSSEGSTASFAGSNAWASPSLCRIPWL
jgi:hypothetical protein